MKRGDPGVRDRHQHERDAELVWPRPARRHPPTPGSVSEVKPTLCDPLSLHREGAGDVRV